MPHRIVADTIGITVVLVHAERAADMPASSAAEATYKNDMQFEPHRTCVQAQLRQESTSIPRAVAAIRWLPQPPCQGSVTPGPGSDQGGGGYFAAPAKTGVIGLCILRLHTFHTTSLYPKVVAVRPGARIDA